MLARAGRVDPLEVHIGKPLRLLPVGDRLRHCTLRGNP
jgi:hypothetical protein